MQAQLVEANASREQALVSQGSSQRLCDENKQECSRLQGQITVWQEELQLLRKEKDTLQQALQDSNSRMGTALGQVVELQERCRRLQESASCQEEESLRKKAKCKQTQHVLQQQLDESKDELRRVQEEVQRFVGQSEQLSAQLQKEREEREECESQLRDCRSQVAEVTAQWKAEQGRSQTLAHELLQAQGFGKQLQADILGLSTEIASAKASQEQGAAAHREASEKLQCCVKEQRQSLEREGVLQGQVQELQAVLEREIQREQVLQDLLAQLRAEKTGMEVLMEEKEKSHAEVACRARQELQAVQEQLEEMRRAHSKLQEERSELVKDGRGLERENAVLQAQLSDLHKQFDAALQKAAKLKEEIAAKQAAEQQALELHQTSRQECATLEERVKSCATRMKEKEEELVEAYKKNTSLGQQVEETGRALERAQERCTVLQKLLDDVRLEKRTMEESALAVQSQKKEDETALRLQVENLRAEVARLQQDCQEMSALQEERDGLKTQLSEVQGELRACQCQRAEAAEESKQLHLRVEDLQREVGSLQGVQHRAYSALKDLRLLLAAFQQVGFAAQRAVGELVGATHVSVEFPVVFVEGRDYDLSGDGTPVEQHNAEVLEFADVLLGQVLPQLLQWVQHHQSESSMLQETAEQERQASSSLKEELQSCRAKLADLSQTCRSLEQENRLLRVDVEEYRALETQYLSCKDELEQLRREITAFNIALAEHGGIPVLVDILEHNMDRALLLGITCRAISQVTLDHQEMQTIFGNAGGIPFLVAILERHMESGGIVSPVCDTIAKVTFRNASNKALFGKCGGVPVVCESLIQYMGERDAVINACWAIRNVTYQNAGNKAQVGDCGGVPMLVNVLQTHQHDPMVAEQCCCSIRNITVHNVPNKLKFGEWGGMKWLARVLQEHVQCAAPIIECCRAISNVTSEDSNCVSFFEHGGLNALAQVIHHYQSKTVVEESSAVLEQAVVALLSCVRSWDQTSSKGPSTGANASSWVQQMEPSIRQQFCDDLESLPERLSVKSFQENVGRLLSLFDCTSA